MIRVRLFAALAEAAGADRLEVDDVASVTELRATLAARFGEPFAGRLARSRAWVDGEDIDPDAPLGGGVEIALLPPFAGG
ncbi:MAG: molybdopterin converting factor small subunit [Glaciecola sp.]|jgi:molybdopterin converting factor small subunit